ncbi:2'-5' RNA ligase family protein [Peribacillus asahii]|uniref:2'-5' RNA ligase family protein n=1 Tax=Peribacillus asahii TaxID=228899 RepID=UPI003830B32A
MKYGVVIFPSKKLQDIANSYRKRYDTKYSFIPPHITLKSSFEATEEELTTIVGRVRQAASKVQPFLINVTKAKSFQPANNTIYLKVEAAPELDMLYQALHGEGTHKTDVEYAFSPHVTIAQELSNDEHLDVMGQLTNLNVEHQEKVDRIHLLYQLEDGVWTVYETFRLGAE